MRPKDHKIPFSWQERIICMEGSIFYAPSHVSNKLPFVLPSWVEIFENDHPVNVEYCSGNGSWVLQRALENPQENWVAVEIKYKRVRKICSKLISYRLQNLLIVCGDAHTVTRDYFSHESVKNIFINFPDPWPKRRHAGRRLMQTPFAAQMVRILQKGGELTLVTDDPTYSRDSIAILREYDVLSSAFAAPYYVTDFPGYGTSYFDQLWRDKGRLIRYHQFFKQIEAN